MQDQAFKELAKVAAHAKETALKDARINNILKGVHDAPAKTHEIHPGIAALEKSFAPKSETTLQQASDGNKAAPGKESEAKGEDNDYIYGMGQ